MVMNSDPAQVLETLRIVETTTRQALHEMRLLVEVLRHEHAVDPALTPTPGLADAAALAGQIRSAGVDLCLDIRGTARPLPAAVDLSAYRIAQEALTNVVRHAGPTQATLRVEYLTEEVVVDVTDSGPSEPHRRKSPVFRSATEPVTTPRTWPMTGVGSSPRSEGLDADALRSELHRHQRSTISRGSARAPRRRVRRGPPG